MRDEECDEEPGKRSPPEGVADLVHLPEEPSKLSSTAAIAGSSKKSKMKEKSKRHRQNKKLKSKLQGDQELWEHVARLTNQQSRHATAALLKALEGGAAVDFHFFEEYNRLRYDAISLVEKDEDSHWLYWDIPF